jgi:hypothetical protein
MKTMMTEKELYKWEKTWFEEIKKVLPCEILGVRFYGNSINCLCFRYKNSRGLVFEGNGYNGRMPDGKDYYPLFRLCCHHNNESRYNPSCEPDLDSLAIAVIKSWDDFISN